MSRRAARRPRWFLPAALVGCLAPAALAEGWYRCHGPGVVVEAPSRYAGLARRVARNFPARVKEVATRLGLVPPRPVALTIGRDAHELAARLGASLSPWVAGVAIQERRAIGLNAASLRPPSAMPAAVILRHELAHLAIGQRTGVGRRIPLWLEEGICQWVGGTTYLGVRADLLPRLSFDDLLAWRDLAVRFPATKPQATLAYLQSFYFVAFLARQYGGPFLLELVDATADGTPVPDFLLARTGQAQVDIEKAWMEYEKRRAWRWFDLCQALSPLAAAAVLVLVAYRRRARHGQELLRQWDEEQAEPRAP